MDLVTVTLENSDSVIPISGKVLSIGRAPSHDLAIKVVLM
jgi:hypothetical protein